MHVYVRYIMYYVEGVMCNSVVGGKMLMWKWWEAT